MDTTVINIIEPPATPVTVNRIETVQEVTVNVSQVGQTGPAGSSGDLNDILFGETPIGVIDGSNATFTSPFDFIPGKLEVYINGLLQKLVTHYQTVGTDTIIFNDSPQTGDTILLNYIKS